MRVTDFTDYRQVVHAWLAEVPQARTQAALARRVGRATSTISMTLMGKRALNPDDAVLWAHGMRLQGADAEHFVDLVRVAHGADADRREAWERVLARQTFAKRTRLPLGHEVFARSSTWAILALVDCAGFRPDPEWIGATLVPPLSAAEVTEAVDQLLLAGLLTRRPDGGLAKSDLPVATEEDEDAERWTALHVEQLQIALTALDGPSADRHVVSVVAAVPQGSMDDIVDRLEGAIREALAGEEEEGPDQVVQISLQILCRSKPTGS